MNKRAPGWMLAIWLSILPAAGWAQAAEPAPPVPTPPSPAKPAAVNAGGTVNDVVSAPFKDLNLVKTEVPPVLAALNGYPYALPVDADCPGLAAEIAELDAVLGADLDTAAVAGKRGKSLAAKSLTQAAHSLVPYRSWVRKLSGAEKRDEKLAAALITGTTRRAFLKGLGSAQACAPPASPLPEPVPPAPPEAAPTAEGQRAPNR